MDFDKNNKLVRMVTMTRGLQRRNKFAPGSIYNSKRDAMSLKCNVWKDFWPCLMINFSWWMEMRFWKVNSIRFKGFRVSIVMAHEKFPTFAFGIRLYFLFLDFWKCQCTLLGALTCELDFIIINKNDHFIQIVY
jgi:hypothetical protein